MKFKTNAKCAGCVGAIKRGLSVLAPAEEWNIDLDSNDRILTYTGTKDIPSAEIVRMVEGAGFQCTPIE